MLGDKLQRANGNWVVGDRFWDRERELDLFTEYLKEGANILLVAPRRIGKTSLMREAARRIEDEFICLQVDLQKNQSASDAIVELSIATQPYLSLWKKTTGVFGNILDKFAGRIDTVGIDDLKITLRSGLDEGNWRAKGERLFEALALSDKPVVIFWDEVPILINRMLKGDDYKITPERRQKADSFMSWLRANSQLHQGKVRQVITGSIGIEPILRQAGLNATLNHFTPFHLEAWADAIAEACLIALANQYNLTFQPTVSEYMIKRLGYCIPHYVQMFFDHVYRYCRLRDKKEITIELVDEVYKNSMLSVRGHAELSHLEERLRMVLGIELYPLALEILTEAAIVGQLTAEAVEILSSYSITDRILRQNAVTEILGVLEHDGYLRKEEDKFYYFVSPLLQDWWKAHFGFGFKSAFERKEKEQ